MADSFETSILQLNFNSNTSLILNPPTEYSPYKCKRCSKSFPSTQALGGHQSSHRKEKAKGKKPQKTPSKNKKRAKTLPKKPKKVKANSLSARATDLKLTLGDAPRRKAKKVKALELSIESSSAAPYNELSFGIGSSCRCGQKQLSTSWIDEVAKFTFNSCPFYDFPQVKMYDEEKVDENDPPTLDLSLKL